MKANELMIDDWVSLGENCQNVQVLGIATDCVITTSEDEDVLPYSNLWPIPLTEEILVSNGYEVVWHHAMFYVNKDTPDESRIHIDELEDIEIDTPFCRYSGCCKHVHELQHALRLCGLTELADNFKVET